MGARGGDQGVPPLHGGQAPGLLLVSVRMYRK
jgi:hypothetical protein